VPRTHTVSEFYLKNFAVAPCSGEIWKYAKETGSCRRVSISKQAEAPPDFYNQALEGQLQRIEERAARPIRRLVLEDVPMRLEEKERRSVSAFMAVQLVRTPSFFRDVLPVATRHWLDEYLRKHRISSETYSIECLRLARPKHTNPPNVLGSWVSEEINEAVEEMAQSFYAANWTIAEPACGLDQFEFLTGDNPISLTVADDNPEAGALLPLSPRRVLWIGGGQPNTVELETISLTLARDINRLTILSSDRHLYASTRQELLQDGTHLRFEDRERNERNDTA